MKLFKLTAIIFFASISFSLCANGSLYNDPAAMAGFTGTTTFNLSQASSILNVDVEYAVFAPGQYGGDDLSGGGAYIYAYQIFNNSASNVAVDFFSVGIPGDSGIDIVYTDTNYGTSGGIDPLAFQFPQSAGYMFMRQSLNPGQNSSVLLFSSDYLPTTGFGAVSGGGLGG
ncbi:MAG: hypothetical protein PHP01_04815, partial [Phycisphaerae bacterium]|nr:hypothetical protein [Phycisphaerae bacterium]